MDILISIFSTDGILIGTIVPFLIVLTVVVFVHEMGHYLVGRWCGIGVDAFSVGFGPEVFGYTAAKGTRWKLSAIPLGGYVKFRGEMTVTGSTETDTEGKYSAEELKTTFHTQPIWKRAATVFAGPLANFILAIAVFSAMIAINGRYVFDPMVAEVIPESAAEAAGLQPGDKFISLDGERVETFADVQRYVSQSAEIPIVMLMERDGVEIEVIVTPERKQITDPLGNDIKVGIIGVRNTEEVGNGRVVEYGPIESIGQAVLQTWGAIEGTGAFLSRFVVGREDKCQLGGPVKIAEMSGKAAQLGSLWLIQLIALLSIGIGILNLLPIPPLDGGHLLFYGVEAVIGGPVPEAVLEVFYRIGFFLVLAFMGFVIWNDIFAC